MQVTDLAHLNVALNATSATLITIGFIAVKTGRTGLHKGFMIAALAVAAVFFVSYGIYHYHVGSIEYTGAWPAGYYCLLISHVTLAAINLPLVIVTATRAFKGQFDKHRKIARITLPVWWYVSITGVIVYLMLY